MIMFSRTATCNLTPVVITNWDAAGGQMRQVFDELWQAWNVAECENYYSDGQHHQYDSSGNVIRQPSPSPRAAS